MKRIVSMFRAFLKFGMPLSLLLVPALAIYGSLAPWPSIQSALDRYVGQTPLLVGASYQARYTDTGNTVSASRSYVMIPSVFSDPKLVTFSQHNQGQVVVAQSRSGLFFLIGWWVLCLLGIWWFWLRRVPPNNSFKPNPLRGSA